MEGLRQDIKWLGDDMYQASKLGNYTMSCTDTRLVRAANCDLCFLEVKPTCGVRADFWTIAVGNRNVQSGTEKVAVKYNINRPLAVHFLTNEQIEVIAGNTLYPAKPNMESFIPPIKLHVSDSQKFIAEDRRIQLQMSRTVESLKRDSLVYNDISAAIIDGIQDLPIQWEWTDYLGIATSAVLVLLIVQLLYLSIRVRQIAIMIMIVQEMCVSLKETASLTCSSQGPFPPPKYKKTHNSYIAT